MSIGDTIFIFFLALIFFGPKKLPELARQIGKLVAEFRRASNEFRFQMEEELRMAEHADAQKKIAAAQPAEASAPIAEGEEFKILPPATGLPVGSSTEGAATEAAAVESEGAPGSEGAAEAAASDAAQSVQDQLKAEAASGEGRAIDQPVQHQPSLLSGLLGPPSQADAVSAPETVSFAHPHERLHSPSAQDAAGALPEEAGQEVQAAHG